MTGAIQNRSSLPSSVTSDLFYISRRLLPLCPLCSELRFLLFNWTWTNTFFLVGWPRCTSENRHMVFSFQISHPWQCLFSFLTNSIGVSFVTRRCFHWETPLASISPTSYVFIMTPGASADHLPRIRFFSTMTVWRMSRKTPETLVPGLTHTKPRTSLR